MGSSIAYQLASRGLKTLVLERFELNHANGSSHGETRIIRTVYSEDPRYVPLVRRAFECWKELKRKSGGNIIRMIGGLTVGPSNGTLLSGAMKSAKEYGLQCELLSSKEAMEKFGVFSFEEGLSALYEKDAGVLFPEESVAAHVSLAKDSGAEFRFTEPLSRWRSVEKGLELETEKDSYAADKVVFAAGAWTTSLLGGVIPLSRERQVPFWFGAADDVGFGVDRMPIFIVQERDGRLFYGIADVGHGVKVARHHGGDVVSPDEVNREVTESDKRPVVEFVRRSLPRLNTEPSSWTTCIYTNTVDGNFVIDFHPRDKRILVVSACSGHGFKFASVMGEIGADQVIDGRTRHDIACFNIARFAALTD